MSNARIVTTSEYLGNPVEIVIEAASLSECLEQLQVLGATQPAPSPAPVAPATEEGNVSSPAPEAPAVTTSAPQTPSEPDTAPATAATPSATQTPEPSSPAPATAEVSGEDVLAAAKKLLTSGPEGEPKLKEALAAVGATTVGTCPAEKRADLLAAINAELGA